MYQCLKIELLRMMGAYVMNSYFITSLSNAADFIYHDTFRNFRNLIEYESKRKT